jgi:hypothetical protein
LAFSIGVAVERVGKVLRQQEPLPVTPKENLRTIALETNVKLDELASDQYYQANEDERRLGIRHDVRRRSEYSSIFGQLSEFVELKGRTKKNTFYVSKIKSTDDQCNEKSKYVCRYVNVYWNEDNCILTLYPLFDREDNTYYEWIYSMRRIDLIKDVVPTWKEVGTTNYLVPKAEAQEMIKDVLREELGSLSKDADDSDGAI